MGLFDFLKGKGGGGAVDERTLMRYAEQVMDKRAMSLDRFAAIEYLCKVATPESWRAVLPRFNYSLDSPIKDREEKQYIYEQVIGEPENAIEPVKEYLRSAASLSWPIKILRNALSREDLVAELVDFLETFDTGYEKNSERKAQIIAALEEETDARVPPAVLPFLDDFNEDVRFHTIRTLTAQGDESAREPLIKRLLADDSVRIRTTIVEGLAERGWNVDEDARDRVTQLLQTVPTGPFVIRDGKIVQATRL